MQVANEPANGSPDAMNSMQQYLTASLTSLEHARLLLLEGLAPVAPVLVPTAQAQGSVAASAPPAAQAAPARDTAMRDGWALASHDLVGATSYSPVPLPHAPVWVEVGDRIPPDCDCVLEPDMVEQIGPLMQAIGEAFPGAGIRRAGEDLTPDDPVIAAGAIIRPIDIVVARAAGLEKLAVRRPRIRIVNVPASSGADLTAQLIAGVARAAGAEVLQAEAGGRDAASIAGALDDEVCDLVVTIGGTGLGRADAAVQALTLRQALLAHGIALAPGRTAALGRLAGCPVVALPGAPDQALAVWWALARPALDCLAGRPISQRVTRPLARKIASAPGIAEIVLLRQEGAGWMPLAIGDLSLRHLASADAWLLVPGDSEGYATGAPCRAFLLHDPID